MVSCRFPHDVEVDLTNGRIFISDTGNHRIVITDLEGQFQDYVGGTLFALIHDPSPSQN